jgi:autotransporter strand-loop-strand O-heptosyltransferase
LISFESKSLGDTLAWLPYIDKFQREKKCIVICSTFLNKLYASQYPNINFIEPGSVVDNIYAEYRVGIFFDNDEVDYSKHPTDPKKVPLGKIASDILGIEYDNELKPKLTLFKDIKKRKEVAIAIHSTAQCKYWNNPKGWQEVVDYLNSKDYTVRLLSQEEDGYMGNPNPYGIKQHRKGPLMDVIKTLQESELFIGISGGLSWLSWAVGTPTILISGFTDKVTEDLKDVHRVINNDVCHGCWSQHKFDPGNWNWCPEHQGTPREFECSKTITSKMVISEIDKILFNK